MALQTTHLAWRSLATRFAERHASSPWRLPLLCLAIAALFFGPLYLLRGLRLVQLGGFAIVAVAAGAYFFAHPFRSIVVAILVFFSGLDAYIPGPMGMALLCVALARSVFDALEGKSIDWGRPVFRTALAVLLLLAFTSVLVAKRTDLVLVEVRNIFIGLVLYVTISQLATSPQKIAGMALAFAASQCIASLLVLRGLLLGGTTALALLFATRFGGLGLDPNMHSGNLDATLPILFAAMGILRGWRRWLVPVLLLLAIASVILSQSRAGVLLLVVVIVVLLLRAGRRGRIIALLSLAGLVAFALILPRGYWIRFESIGQLGGITVDRSLLLRQHVSEIALDVARDNLWLGVGLGNFRHEAPRHMLGEMLAHNSFLEVAATLGIFGLLAYLTCLGASVSAARRASRDWRSTQDHAAAVFAGNIGWSIAVYSAMALTLSVPFSPILWVLLGLANAARRSAAADALAYARKALQTPAGPDPLGQP